MVVNDIGRKKYQETKRIIRNANSEQQLVLFVGAGVSAKSGIPLWGDAISRIVNCLDIECDQVDYLKAP